MERPQEVSQYDVSQKKKKESEISSPYTREVVKATSHIRCSIATSQVVTDNPFMLVRKGEERDFKSRNEGWGFSESHNLSFWKQDKF